MKELEKIVDSNGEPLEIVDAEARADISEIKQSLSDLTTFEKTASGAIVTFDDGSDLPMPKLEIAVEPQQDLHGYDGPWVGGAGKNKCPQLITEFTYSANAGGSHTANDGVLVVSVTSTNNSGVYTLPSFVKSYSQVCSYSMDIKADVSMNTLVGFTNFGRKEVSLTNQWQRVTFDNVTFDGSTQTLVIYGRGTAGTISVKNFMFELGSVSHDYAPYSNICPISGWNEVNVTRCEKNLCKSTIHGYVSSADYLIIINNDTESAIFYAHEGQTYTISSSATMNKSRVALVGTDNVVNYTPILQREVLADNVNTWTATWTGWTVWYKCNSRQTAFDNSTQVEVGDTATTYEPYNDSTYIIDLDGTRYGGTLDVISGVLTVDRMLVDMGTLNWSIISWQGVNYIVSQTIQNVCVKPSSDNIKGNILCSNYPNIPRSSISTTTDKIISLDANGNINVVDSNYATASDFKTAMNGVQLVYELATPQTYQLTPTQVKSLLGVNNIWADTGDLELTYFVNNNLVQAIYDMVNILTS